MSKRTIHNSLSLSHQDKLRSKSEQTSGRYLKFHGSYSIDGIHIRQLSFFISDHIDDGACQFLIDINDDVLYRLSFFAMIHLENDLRSRDLQFKSFSPHRLNEYR